MRLTITLGTGSSGREMGREERVKEVLDSSLSSINIGPGGSFMTISRFPNNEWQLNCAETTTNISCEVQVARLGVVIYITEPVSKYFNLNKSD